MKTAMILAAGRGERLRPITDLCPKALCLVHSKPLIEYHIENLAKAGFTRIVINHAYLGGQIRQSIGTGKRFAVEIIYTPEPPGGLETGGGIVNALPFLGSEPFLVVNADIYTDFDFKLAMNQSHLAHLILVKTPDYKLHGDFGLTHEKLVENSNREYTFPGIGIYRPELFSQCRIGRYSLTPLLRKLAEDKQVSGEVFDGQWIDIGSMERLALANSSARSIP